MSLKNLPIGISTLSLLLDSNCIYVDKTEYAYNLIKTPGRFFLSRPRRFGKSLFVDTLKEIFEGNQKLFEGTYIHEKWDWTKKYPVIKIDLAEGVLKSREDLDKKIREILEFNKKNLGITTQNESISGIFSEIIVDARKKYGERAVVLVDEYDKPILDNINNPTLAIEMREGLKNIYSVLKSQDANLQFVFMTGVTKFSKVNLFSGLNQLKDITISEAYSSICGYTEQDLQKHFSEHLLGSDPKEVKDWYNGYNWTGKDTVYNPFDILLFLSEGQRFRNYWFETGSPSFLIELFKKNQYFLPDLENIQTNEEILESFDVGITNPIALLFQSGYLTIKETYTEDQELIFILKIPNREVRQALNNHFINGYAALTNHKFDLQLKLKRALASGEVEIIFQTIQRVFAGIPWRNFTNNDLADFEGYYASVLYAFFASLNAQVIPEDITNHGQADMTILLGDHIYVMEIKVVDENTIEGNPALDQIMKRNYAEKYRGIAGKTVHELGLVFSRKTRNLIQANGI